MNSKPGIPSFVIELSGMGIPGILRAAKSRGDDAQAALATVPLSLESAATLLQCPVEPILDDLVGRARALTLEHHGRSIALHAPCYLSSFCTNECVYCDQPGGGRVPRVWHSPVRVRNAAERLARHGLKRVLLVAGESATIVTPESIARRSPPRVLVARSTPRGARRGR
jgi:2-iminoacetate synthase